MIPRNGRGKKKIKVTDCWELLLSERNEKEKENQKISIREKRTMHMDMFKYLNTLFAFLACSRCLTYVPSKKKEKRCLTYAILLRMYQDYEGDLTVLPYISWGDNKIITSVGILKRLLYICDLL